MYRNVRGQASLDMNIDSVISSNTWKYGLCYIVELLQYLFHRDVQDVSTRFSLDNCLISFPYKSQSILKVMMAMTQLASHKPAARTQHWHKLLLDSQSCSGSAHSFVSLQGSWDKVCIGTKKTIMPEYFQTCVWLEREQCEGNPRTRFSCSRPSVWWSKRPPWTTLTSLLPFQSRAGKVGSTGPPLFCQT